MQRLRNDGVILSSCNSDGSGFDLMNTLHCPLALALGMLNWTMWPNPSCCRNSAAVLNSVSEMLRFARFPCLNDRNETTFPFARRMFSFTLSKVGCSITLSQAALVISLRNFKRKRQAIKPLLKNATFYH